MAIFWGTIFTEPHYHNFLSSSFDLMQPRSRDFFSNFKKHKDAGHEFGCDAFAQRLRVFFFFLNMDYLKNRRHNFIQKNYCRKIRLLSTHVSFSGLYFFFLYRHFAVLMTPKSKKRINKALSKQPIQFLLPFHFLVYKD